MLYLRNMINTRNFDDITDTKKTEVKTYSFSYHLATCLEPSVLYCWPFLKPSNPWSGVFQSYREKPLNRLNSSGCPDPSRGESHDNSESN